SDADGGEVKAAGLPQGERREGQRAADVAEGIYGDRRVARADGFAEDGEQGEGQSGKEDEEVAEYRRAFAGRVGGGQSVKDGDSAHGDQHAGRLARGDALLADGGGD